VLYSGAAVVVLGFGIYFVVKAVRFATS